MKTLLLRLLLPLVALVAGCVAYSPPVDKAAAPKPGMAYLTGIFVDTSVQTGALIQRRMGISFEHQETKTTHSIEFQVNGRDLQLIEVPPGTYRVSSWFMANTMNEVLMRGKPQGTLFTREFKVGANEVCFLGQYTGSGTVTQSGNMIYRNAQIKPERIVPVPTDREAFSAKFPKFGNLPMKAAFF